MIYDYLYIRDRGQTGEGHLYFIDLGEQNGNFEGVCRGGGGRTNAIGPIGEH